MTRSSAPALCPHLPRAWLFTDPWRLPNPVGILAQQAPGLGVVFRHFGQADYKALAPHMRTLALARGDLFLVGADTRLAQNVSADGVHLPERLAHTLPRLRKRYPGWWLSTSAHSLSALYQAQQWGADFVFLSSVLSSDSPSAGRAIGLTRACTWARRVSVPVYALGGVDAHTPLPSAFAGYAGISCWKDEGT